MILIALDSIPLHDPSDGWHANAGFWVRTFTNAFISSGGILIQIQKLILDKPLATMKILGIMGGVGIGYTSSLMLLAKYWVFPVPFMMTVSGIPFVVFMNGFTLLAIGTKDRVLLHKLMKFSNIIVVQGTMVVVYPSFNAIFLTLDRMPQVAFAVLLPAIKLSFKYIIARVASDFDDLRPSIVASVDLFDALYMTKCMQSAGTIWVGCAIIVLDLVQNYAAVSSLFKQFQALHTAHARRNGVEGGVTKGLLNVIYNLLTKRQLVPARSLQIVSQSILTLSPEAQAELHRLRCIQIEQAVRSFPCEDPKTRSTTASGPSAVDVASTVPASVAQRIGFASVVPHCGDPMKRGAPPADFEEKNMALINETVSLLHQSEEVVLVEYIEAAVPIFYVLYITILFNLRNAKYYQDIEQLTTENFRRVVSNILIYAGLELLSLVYVNQALKRKVGISGFYQLAFTLEHEWRIFQSNFVTWILFTFQFLLIHNGKELPRILA